MALNELLNAIYASLILTIQKLWNMFILKLPNLFIAMVILIVGYIVGKIIGKFVYLFFHKILNIDGWLARKKLERTFFKANVSRILANMVKWYIFVLFLAEALVYVLPVTSSFLTMLTLYLPRIFGAIIMFIVGMFIGEMARKEVLKMDFEYRGKIGTIVKYLIGYIALVIGLQTIGFDVTILVELFRIAFAGLVLTAAIVVGIGFGIAYKDEIGRAAKTVFRKKKRSK